MRKILSALFALALLAFFAPSQSKAFFDYSGGAIGANFGVGGAVWNPGFYNPAINYSMWGGGYNLNSLNGGGWGGYPAGFGFGPGGFIGTPGFGVGGGGFPAGPACNGGALTGGFGGFYSPYVGGF